MAYTKRRSGLKRSALVAAALAGSASAQTFRRTAACPNLGCIFPPDQSAFIAGQVFDLRVEVQAPANGTMPFNNGKPYESFTLSIGKKGQELKDVTKAFSVADPKSSFYNFTYFEDLFAQDAKTPTLVNVVAKDYRHLALYDPGEYELKLKYNNGMEETATWEVLPLSKKKLAKNVILFIGDGMAPGMTTAARLLGHKSVNGKYQSTLALDGCEGFGMQHTHSLDSFITDSANSATALMAGKKSTVNALNAYTDSTGKPYANPKFETIFEMGRRIYNSKIGIVSTAYLADATPAAVVAHTSLRSQYDLIIDQYLDGVTSNFSWTKWDGPDVLFGGGGSDFVAKASNRNVSKIDKFLAKGYEFVTTNSSLHNIGNSKRALGLFSASTLPTWVDRHVFPENLPTFKAYNEANKTFTAPTTDVPGLKEMTLKALDILTTRSKADGTNFMLMSEAASIDKAMHIADYPRALGELLELDNTVAATLEYLEKHNLRDETLVVVTADHGHGFDVFGSADTKYLKAAQGNDKKRNAIGTYVNSGLSGYQVPAGVSPQNNTVVTGPWGEGFPVDWQPRYTAAMGFAADVDQYEDYTTRNKSRTTSLTKLANGTYRADPSDAPDGFFISGNLPTTDDQGVHSQVFTWGPAASLFNGMQDSTQIAQKIAQALDLGKVHNATARVHGPRH
ncbi:hypothetical protein RTG_01427 [Rhodotorula toruloides ATCC 204091]|uniref:alkaline phosphatase n=1 Tax=Rhodotorula toruloides TaxID=5286 RepID=A0A0K3CHG1_RHOTO|nr:hypothetical protein RTG_01427 [Rhodotorula toruloides ATCC 204091]